MPTSNRLHVRLRALRSASSIPSLAAIALLAAAPMAYAQGSQNATARILEPINTAQYVRVEGNVRSAALVATNDRGVVDDTMRLDHMLLEMQRSPEREAALNDFLAKVNDTRSPLFHKWLTAAQIGEEYGPAVTDIASVESWLRSEGFTVNAVSPNGMTIDFSGNAGQVAHAFHTPMHHLLVNGEAHVANTENPAIPSAFAGVVAGVVTLNDFRPHALHRNIIANHIDPRTGAATSEGTTATAAGTIHPDYTFSSGGGTYQAVVPGDLAAIYNLNPLFQAGYSGQGQIIVVIEDTDVYSVNDWTTFRAALGLSGYTSGSFLQAHPAALIRG